MLGLVVVRWHSQRASERTAARCIFVVSALNLQTNVYHYLQIRPQSTLTGHRYVEAVGIRYSQNKFPVRLLKTVIDLRRTVIPCSLNMIRFLRIETRLHFPVPLEAIDETKSNYDYPSDEGVMWLSTCWAISLMHGLHNLYISVEDASQDRDNGKAASMYAQFYSYSWKWSCFCFKSRFIHYLMWKQCSTIFLKHRLSLSARERHRFGYGVNEW